jgi:hypothetical protein
LSQARWQTFTGNATREFDKSRRLKRSGVGF